MFAQFRNKRWKVVTTTTKGTLKRNLDGYAEHAHEKGKTLYVAQSLRNGKLLETLLHEALHCCLPDLREEVVTTVAADLGRFLGRVGYSIPADDRAKFVGRTLEDES